MGTGGSKCVNEQTALLPRFKAKRQSFAQSLVTIIGISIDIHGHVISHPRHSRLLENQLSPRSTRLVLKVAVLFWANSQRSASLDVAIFGNGLAGGF